MTENRFFRSLLTITASSVLVGGSLILLTSTAPWTPAPQAESEPSTPDSAAIRGWARHRISAAFD